MKKNFKKEYLIDELDLPFLADERKVINTNGRWTEIVEIIFRLPDQIDETAWLTTYERGSTEDCNISPWEYKENVECTLVRKKKILVEMWSEVDK